MIINVFWALSFLCCAPLSGCHALFGWLPLPKWSPFKTRTRPSRRPGRAGLQMHSSLRVALIVLHESAHKLDCGLFSITESWCLDVVGKKKFHSCVLMLTGWFHRTQTKTVNQSWCFQVCLATRERKNNLDNQSDCRVKVEILTLLCSALFPRVIFEDLERKQFCR